MSRQSRLREYAKPLRPENWQGASRDMENIDRWSARASANSDGDRHRATGPVLGGPQGTKDQDLPTLPNTGKKQVSRPTEMGPMVPRKVNSVMTDAKRDLNHTGESDYLAGIRRTS